MGQFRRSYDLAILLGAGASFDADIPHSRKMIEDLESRILGEDAKWNRFREIYNCVRSGIIFSEGTQGRFDSYESYNIEMLVDTLSEIGKGQKHVLFPFIGSWSPALSKFATNDFELATELISQITQLLRTEWLGVPNYSKAGYFSGFFDFQQCFNYPLHIFTLNYDLCLERTAEKHGVDLEIGFDDQNNWNWHLFEGNQDNWKSIYLYKLHGSMDWSINGTELKRHDESIGVTNPAFIFGRTQKFEFIDPFFPLTYEFRRRTLESRLILVIGYGFGDSHINGIIGQALNSGKRKILCVVGPIDNNATQKRRMQIAHLVSCSDLSQVQLRSETAKDFILKHLSVKTLEQVLPDEDDENLPF